MPRSLVSRTVAGALGMTMLAAGALAAPGDGQVGTAAADFTLQDTMGGFHTLSDQRGKVVMLSIVGYG